VRRFGRRAPVRSEGASDVSWWAIGAAEHMRVAARATRSRVGAAAAARAAVPADLSLCCPPPPAAAAWMTNRAPRSAFRVHRMSSFDNDPHTRRRCGGAREGDAMIEATAPTTHSKLLAWVEEIAALTQPERVHWFDGSREEFELLCRTLVEAGPSSRSTAAAAGGAISPAQTPATSPASRTGRSSAPSASAMPAPTNNWRDPAEMRATLQGLFAGLACAALDVRRAVLDGPLGSPIAHVGIEITDSAYVAASMAIMTRAGRGALE